MRLSQEQLDRYERDGFLVLPDLFSTPEIEVLRAELPALFAEQRPENWREKSGQVRSAFALHLRSEVFGLLTRHPRLIEAAKQIAGDALYVQQVKINVKAAFVGEVWQWHYDFATHHSEDGVPEPLALNLHVFIDDVTEFNGPLWFIPGSHRQDRVEARLDRVTTSYPLWVVDPDTVARLIARGGGIVSAKGRAGTGLIFGDRLVHGSPPNMSPWDRRIFSVIANPVSNALTTSKRPEYIHERDLTPIVPVDDDCLLKLASLAVE